ncbi:hypothetical protein [Staphylococcus phage vB_SauM-V1SA19]|nr:hypothetical protein [Staphylococcus phage vB_SauM-V1SA19]
MQICIVMHQQNVCIHSLNIYLRGIKTFSKIGNP